ncbi:hypothetical protein KP509_24G063800 [Ceratopteris richardii]|uniref:Secreted protein n=1 Tax=Ceratopteris richardii TaxID=49495 RepID=A0A8T2RV88_CERRI|nr:hypothetical protein KP509_24G063800 [Ceratopteris richardii]
MIHAIGIILFRWHAASLRPIQFNSGSLVLTWCSSRLLPVPLHISTNASNMVLPGGASHRTSSSFPTFAKCFKQTSCFRLSTMHSHVSHTANGPSCL